MTEEEQMEEAIRESVRVGEEEERKREKER